MNVKYSDVILNLKCLCICNGLSSIKLISGEIFLYFRKLLFRFVNAHV